MLSAQPDGLWHSLYLLYYIGQSARNGIVRSAVSVLRVQQSPRRSRYPQHIQPLPQLTHDPLLFNPCKPPWSRQNLWYGQRRYNRQPHIRPDQDSQELYEELRLVSRYAKYQRVRELVGLLIRKHKKAPDQRLYRALILANTNPEHGTPTEVEALLQEMVHMDISPDAATYHGALKASNQNEGSAIRLSSQSF